MNRFFTLGRRSLSILLTLGLAGQAKAQVDVTGALVGNGSYGTLGDAFTAINGGVQTGATIQIDIVGNTTESATATLNAGAWASLTIAPSGGAARTISGTLAAPIVNLNGADLVTIDGLNTGGNSLTISNLSTSNTAGTSTIRFIADATNNTVQNCTILGSSTTTVGGSIFFSTGTSTGNDGNTITGCNISAAGATPLVAISSTGSSTAIDNSGITISSNNISDYYGASAPSYGIYVVSNSSAWTISGNRFFQTATRTSTSGSVHRVINITTASGGGYSITGNTIGFANSSGTGVTTYTGGFANRLVGIDLTAANTPVSSIQGNTIAGITLTSTSGATATPGVFTGIAVNGGCNIGTVTGNTIGVTSGTGSISLSSTNTTAVWGIYATSTGTLDIRNNNVAGISMTGTASIAYTFYGVHTVAASSTSTLNILDNNIGSASAGSISIGSSGVTTAALQFNGILNGAGPATLNVTGNVIRGVTMHSTSSAYTAISNTGSISTATNINSNQVGNAGGGALTLTAITSSAAIIGITNSIGLAANALSISSNNFQGFTHSVNGNSTYTFIINSALGTSRNISNNTFTNLSLATGGSVTFISNNVTTGTGSKTIDGNSIVTAFAKTVSGGTVTLYTDPASSGNGGTVSNSNNNFSNITLTGTTTMAGWSNTDGSTGAGPTKTVQNNTFSNWTCGSGTVTVLTVDWSNTGTTSGNTLSNITGSGAITGILSTTSTDTFTGNTIQTLQSSGSGSAVTGVYITNGTTKTVSGNTISGLQTNGATAVGIRVDGGTTTNIRDNRIYNLEGTNANGSAYGIRTVGGTTVNITNNRIGDLRAPAGSGTNQVVGIYLEGGTSTTRNVQYNSIWLNASSSAANFGTSGVFHNSSTTATTNQLLLQNNIIVNTSTPNGGNNTAAFRRGTTSGTHLANYNSASNNNLFYAGTPASNRLIFTDGTSSAQTLSDYKAGVFPSGTIAPRDANSVTENPPFLSTSGASANFLKIDPATATQVESGGIAIGGITSDFEGDIRQGSFGYSGTGTAPDIGADEFEGTPLDIAAPSISYSALANQCGGGDRTLSATITDASGVPTSGSGLPRLRWRINAGAWSYATGVHISGSTYEFTFGAGSVGGDVVQYYVVAQDNATPTPNVGAFPSTGAGGFSDTPPSASTPPTTPSSYTVLYTLGGTYTVGNSQSAPFNTLRNAVDRYNVSCLTAAVVFELEDASYTTGTGEVFPIAVLNNPDASATNTLTIRPAAATAVSVNGTVAGNPLINLNGARYVTFDGVNTGGATLTLANASTSNTAGTATIRFINDAVSNAVTRCNVQGSSTVSSTTEGGVITFMGGTATGNDDNTISLCDIGPVGSNLPVRCIFSSGSTGSLALHNSGVQVLNNQFHDYFSPTAASNGIFLNTGCTDWTISGNKFYQGAARVFTSSVSHRVIEITTASLATVGGYTISNNTIGFANASGTGTYTLSGVSGTFRGISLTFSSTNSALSNVDGNTIAGISHSSSASGTTSGSPFMLIYVAQGLVNIGANTGNTLGSQSAAGSVSFSTDTGFSVDIYGIYNLSSLATTIANNTIGGFTAGMTAASGVFAPIAVNTLSSVNSTVTDNVVGGTVANSIQINPSNDNPILRGIMFVTSNATVTGNTVRNLTAFAGQPGVGSTSSVTGIWFGSTSVNHSVSRNTIHSLRNANAGGTRAVLGMYYTSSTGTNVVERNFIHSLEASASGATLVGIYIAGGTTTYRNNMVRLGVDAAGASITTPLIIEGIWVAGGTPTLWHNSVYIGGTAVTSGSNNTWALYNNSTGTRNFRNNILFNARSNAGSGGRHYAIEVGSITSLTSDNNLLHAPGAGGATGLYSSAVRQTLADWQSATSRDASSIAGDPRFIDPDGSAATVDLHIHPTNPTPIEGSGFTVAVTDDYDGQVRSGLTPVDIGADAGDFVFGETLPPTIAYTPLTTPSCDLSTRVLTATITDASGVPTAGIGLPRLRWRVNAGAWTYVTAVHLGGSNYEFTFAGGLASGDVVEYYVVAQDNNGNVGTQPAGGAGLGIDPPSASAPPPASVLTIGLILNGTYTVGNAQSAPFNTLRSAIDAYNGACLTGAVVFELEDASYTTGTGEVFPITINNNLDASATNTLTIRPAAGNAATVQGTIASGPMIDFSGARYVTFDGLNTGGATLTITNTSNAATSNTSTVRFIADAVNNTFTRCVLLGSFSGTTITTNGGTVLFGASAVASGSDNNTISFCRLGPAGSNLPVKAFHFGGSSSTETLRSSGNIVDNCEIHDYFHPDANSAGIYVTSNDGTTALTISNNKFYQTGTRTFTTAAQHSSIWLANAGGNNFQVTGNTIGYSSGSGTGAYTVDGGVAWSFVPIHVTVGTTTASTIQNNTITAISMGGASSGTGTSAPFRGIYVTGGLANCNGNTIGSLSGTGSITFTSTSSSAADVTAIYNAGSSNWTTNNNQIGGITTGGGTGARNFYGLRCNTSSSVSWTANNNTIGGTVANSIESTSTSTGVAMRGILNENPGASFSGNTVRNITAAGGTGTFGSASIIGISVVASFANHTLSGNTVHSLANTNGSGTRHVLGTHFTSSTGTNLIERNLLHSLTVASTGGTIIGMNMLGGTNTYRNNMIRLGVDKDGNSLTMACTIYGMWDVSGVRNVWHNSVYVGGSSVDVGSAATYALYSDGTSTRSYRNNILFNARSNAAAGANHYAIYTVSLTGLTSDHNNLHVSGNGGHIGFFGSARLTLNDWRTATSGRDVNSPGGDPQFFAPNGTAATVDLHIHPTNPTPVEGTGFAVAVTDDFDGQDRSTLTPVDIGADAGNFVFGDLEPPTITYTPLGSPGCVTGTRTLNVTITDAISGVPVAGAGQPVLYWRINAGSWTGVTATSISAPTFTFDFGSGTAGGDVVQYYVAAQDGSGNVTTEPFVGAGGFTANPPAASTPPTTPSSYSIAYTLAGTYSVGSAEPAPFNTLTGAVNAYNSGCLAGPVVFELTDATYSGSETFPISIGYNADASSTNTLTIQPAASTSPTITGSSTNAILQLNGADFVRIEGSNAPVTNGLCQTNSSRDLTIANTNTGTSSAVVWLQSASSPALGATNNVVRNCTITGNGSTTTLMGIGSGGSSISTTSLGLDNDNNTYENNAVSSCQIGIYSAGASALNKNEVTAIRYNVLSTHGAAGIFVRFENAVTITGNSVDNVTTTASADVVGISAGYAYSDITSTSAGTGEVSNATITHNQVGNVFSTITYSAVGIGYGTVASGTTLIANNTVSGVRSNGTLGDICAGILLGGGAGTVNLYHNTVRMQGTITGATAATQTSAALAMITAGANTDIRNNILVNTQQGNTGATLRFTAIALGHTTYTFTSNNNDLFAAGGGPGTYTTGITGGVVTGTSRVTLANWQSTTAKDGLSLNVSPVFISGTDLHLSPTSAVNGTLVGAGANVGVAQDIDCDARAASPTIGADEFRAVYYSQATGDVNTNIWDVVPVGTPGPAIWGGGSSMVVQNTHTVTNTANVTVRNLSVDNGGTLVLNASTTLTAKGSAVTQNGTLTANDNSTLALDGSLAMAVSLGSTTSLWDLSVNTPSGTTVTGNLHMRGSLDLLGGNFDCTGNQVALKSTATYTGRLGPVAPTASYTGNLRIERYIPAGATNWRLFGSPVQGQQVLNFQDDFITAGYPGSPYPNFDNPVGSGILWPSIRWYDETNTYAHVDSGLVGVTSSAMPLGLGQGFAAWCGTNLVSTLAFTVDLENTAPVIANTPVSLPMSYTSTGFPLIDGWNLVSNPLPSPVAFDQLARNGDVDDVVYFYNPAAGNISYWQITPPTSLNGGSNVIQSMQGFFLKATGPSPSVQVEEADKINTNSGGFFGLTEEDNIALRLRITSSINTFNDEAVVLFNAGEPVVESMDAIKFVFGDPTAPQVATLGPNGEQLAINAYGSMQDGLSIPVSVNAGVTGTYTLTITEQGEVGLTCITLEDLVTGTITPMNDGATYSFVLNANDDPSVARFMLHATMPVAFTSTNALCGGAPDGSASVTILNGPADVVWTDDLGNQILADMGVTGVSSIGDLGPGGYEVHVYSGTACGALTMPFFIEAPFVLEAQGTVVDATCSDVSDGSVELLVLGGTAPFSIAWNDAGGSTSEVLTAVPGTYNVTITDANGCTWTQGFTIGSSGPTAEFTASATIVLTGQDVQFTSVQTNVNHVWDFGDGELSAEENPMHIYELPGTYIVTHTVDNGSCLEASTVTITVELSTGSVEVAQPSQARAWQADDQIVVLHAFTGTGTVIVDLLDATGRLVMQRSTPAQTVRVLLPASELNTGVWFVRLRQGEEQVTLRIPVMR